MNALQRALAIETHVARIVGKQSLNGVQFDKPRASFYVFELEVRAQELYRKIRPHLQLEVDRPYKQSTDSVNKPWLKSGDWSKSVIAWYGEDIPDIMGAFSRVEFVEPDLGKRAKLIEQLLKLGWNPAEYTPVTEKGGGGNPKLTVDDPKGGKMICPPRS